MSREIKFRIFNKKENKWHCLFKTMGGFSLFGEFVLLGGMCLDINNLNDLEVMQFTGLKDKNGADAYEGDIVKYDGEIGFIEFDVGKFYVHWVNKTWLTDEMRVLGQHVEIIGNIHEHPHLLGGQDA